MKIEPEQPVAEKQTHLRPRGCLLSLSLTLICVIYIMTIIMLDQGWLDNGGAWVAKGVWLAEENGLWASPSYLIEPDHRARFASSLLQWWWT